MSYWCCAYAVTAKKGSGDAKETLEVVDLVQLQVRSVSPVASPKLAAKTQAARTEAVAETPDRADGP